MKSAFITRWILNTSQIRFRLQYEKKVNSRNVFIVKKGNRTQLMNKKKTAQNGQSFLYLIKMWDHTLISTSTPDGSSSFIKASTVLEEEE